MPSERTHTDDTEPTDVAEDDVSDETEHSQVCSDCGGRLETDPARAETSCTECGRVVEIEQVDRGPEWRAFDAEERKTKCRVGPTMTKLRHDERLSTIISKQNSDGYGKPLSPYQREKIQRLRKWNERFRTRNAKERNLKQALGEIDRMGSTLGLPKEVREMAAVIYRRALDENLLPGRSIEGVATAAVYAASRRSGMPRYLDEIVSVSRIEREQIMRTYRYIVKELDLEVRPADPKDFVPRFASDLELPSETERRAVDLLDIAAEQNIVSGKSPVSLAAAALYAACLRTGRKCTQSQISEVTDVSEVTIRKWYRELLDATEASHTK